MENVEIVNQVENQLREFAKEADQWFSTKPFIEQRYKFFKEFKKRENLENADWKYFQSLGDHINAFVTNRLAGANALGRKNHSIKHYRKSFIDLIYGNDSIDKRIDKFIKDIKYFNLSSTSELVGQLFPEDYVFYNGPDKEAISILGIDIGEKRGDSNGVKFVKYNNAIKDIIVKYKTLVGKRTKTTIPLEVDQFFWYLSETKKPDLNYWAGGFHWGETTNKYNEFVDEGYFQIGWSSDDAKGKPFYKLIKQFNVGDKICLKTLSGTHHLKIYAIGDIVNVDDAKNGRVEVEYNVFEDLYNGQAPKGSGSGNWFGTLLQVKRNDDIDMIFNNKQPAVSEETNNWKCKNPNIILYGPPGTGKTYNSIELAYEIINGSDAPSHKVAQDFFKQERGNQIEFITFHQNYAYEDFVQGLKPDFDNPELRFSKVNGGFFNICTNALFEYYLKYSKQLPKKSDPDFQVIFSSFVDWLKSTGLQSITFKTKEGNPIKIKDIVNDKYIHAVHGESDVKHTISSDRLEKLFYAFNDIDEIKNVKDDITEVIGGCNASIFWTFFNELLAFEKRNKEDLKQAVNELKLDSDVFDLEEKRKRINEVGLDKLSTFIEDNNVEVPRYVLIIDEINRANISRVFGELITLIESDKRLGQKHEIISTLPSGDAFAIPPNVTIIGTMNTADKSIALVDIALRRRFEFRRKYPKYFIEGHEIKHVDQLKKMNDKIKSLKSADFQIGHSYFMDDDFDLDYTMNNKIIPLLYEYFMNNVDAIKDVLKEGGFTFSDENKSVSGLIEFIEESAKEGSSDIPETEE